MPMILRGVAYYDGYRKTQSSQEKENPVPVDTEKHSCSSHKDFPVEEIELTALDSESRVAAPFGYIYNNSRSLTVAIRNIRNQELIRRNRVTDVAQRTKVALTDVGVPKNWNGDLAPVNAALVAPSRGGRLTSSESEGATGPKRHKTVVFGTTYKRPMSSSGRPLVDIMIMIFAYKSPIDKRFYTPLFLVCRYLE
ncbi:jg11247 [Pararge aegeria aegeria]|uniref:Jg11247 protein n=1 Tax=Pararge aegeria aegeria TaxID=348720 RepID=A0A8S4RMM9_9NEOP|nr:jg11247 [Pararge aegeria aegeria]